MADPSNLTQHLDLFQRPAGFDAAPFDEKGPGAADDICQRGLAARMHVRRFATYVEILAPAKINLFLEVLAKRPDGYHEIETLLAPVSVYDSLVFAPRRNEGIDLEVRWAVAFAARRDGCAVDSTAARELLFGEIPCGPENLAWKAAELIRKHAGIQGGATIRIVKRIPMAAGLGGASSDAAATLVAANEAWQLKWSRQQLIDLASELGSDVPFFLSGGGAICRGRGERIEKIRLPWQHIVIVRPPVGLSTPQVYGASRPTDDLVGLSLLLKALASGNVAQAGSQLVNSLQPAATTLTPWIVTLKNVFGKQDLLGHQMSGSGSCYFGLCRSARHARRLAARLRAMNIGAVFPATTAVAS